MKNLTFQLFITSSMKAGNSKTKYNCKLHELKKKKCELLEVFWLHVMSSNESRHSQCGDLLIKPIVSTQLMFL